MIRTSRLLTELNRTIRRPARLRKLLDRSAWRRLRASLAGGAEPTWSGPHRSYRSYDEYVAHQRSKLHRIEGLAERDEQWRRRLRARLVEHGVEVDGRSVLCLAARLGGEVRAFRDLGAFAVGVDLNPGPDNRWVLPGDFHSLDYPDSSANVIFTNSLDHGLDLARVAGEMRRVVKPGGLVIVEALVGEAEGGQFGTWEAARWETIDCLIEILTVAGLEVRSRWRFDDPWPGESIHLGAVKGIAEVGSGPPR